MSSGPLVGWWEVLYHRISSNIWYIRLMTSGWVYGCMPSWTLYSWLIESPNNCGLPSSSCAFQEPILCFRHQYLEMVGSPPCEARPLQPPDRKKRLIYLELAQLLLRKYPSQSTQRSVQFLLLLVGTQVSSHCHDYPGWKGLQGVMWKSMWTFPRWLDLRQWSALMHGIGENSWTITPFGVQAYARTIVMTCLEVYEHDVEFGQHHQF